MFLFIMAIYSLLKHEESKKQNQIISKNKKVMDVWSWVKFENIAIIFETWWNPLFEHQYFNIFMSKALFLYINHAQTQVIDELKPIDHRKIIYFFFKYVPKTGSKSVNLVFFH